MAATELPFLSTQALGLLGVELPALVSVQVALTGGGSGKYHVPRGERYYGGGCRHAGSATGASTYPLIEVAGEICRRCHPTLPGPEDALWRAGAHIASRAADLERARSDAKAATWLGYARYAAQEQPGDREQLQAWLELAAAKRALAKDAKALAVAAKQVAEGFAAFLAGYAQRCPQVDAYNGARDAVLRTTDGPQHRALEEVTAAVAGRSTRPAGRYEGPARVDVWQVTAGVWLAARSRGQDPVRAAGLVQDAVGGELGGARVVDVTRLPAPRTAGAGYVSPSAWADAEFAGWWPRAVAEACTALEASFEAEQDLGVTRLLLVRDWPLTDSRDAPIAYLAACPVLGPLVPHNYRRRDHYGAADTSGPRWAAVIAAPGHIAAKLEQEEAGLGRHHTPRFTAAGPVTGRRRADETAALELLRTAFPLLPGDEDTSEGPPGVPDVVQAQRRARAGADQQVAAGDEERASRLAYSLADGYGCWIPGGAEETALLAELHRWLRGRVLRLDVWCPAPGGRDTWASLFGTLAQVGDGEVGFRPGGQHQPVRIPLHRVVALSGAPRWERTHHPYGSDPLWEPYEPRPVPGPSGGDAQ
ncbi:hypothetical protein [Streptacidiphilus sp. EB103A]|uniref:hypothetical protein n=1 Tax=Streptacidiphilus sp. EB103A TaxID=3156275 RepID=UPI003511C25F